ncbi:primosomal protein N' [bacterium]|nr:MAG: primosomal protein N' [bacterium]
MWGVLRDYFGEEVAVLHSYLSPGERADAWRKIRKGEVNLVLGARSAVFAPVNNLGLIIVDEEHDGSYKQGSSPYYNARDMAITRGKFENALVILGSATPAIESFYNAIQGKFKLIEMLERVPGAKLPSVEVIDLRKLRYRERIFSPLAKSSILKRIEMNEQSILLLNRRGFSTSLICPDCGYVPRCPHCEVTLTYHRVGDELKCHWCDYETPAPDNCPNCNSDDFKHRGKGTQKIEVQLYDFVEPERVLRIDSDAIGRKGSLNKILTKFASNPGSILVGTQMVAKGHDFPDVTLVVVIDADVGMALPDFRAGEKTLQLLSQVAGRAGRGERPGLVIIQTRHPDEPAVQFAVNHDYRAFFRHTLARRQILQYPPYSRLVRILAQSEDSHRAEKSLRTILRALLKENIPDVKPLSPTKPPLAKLKGEYRWHLLIKSGDIRKLLPFLNRIAQARFKNVKLRVDVDPYDMM